MNGVVPRVALLASAGEHTVDVETRNELASWNWTCAYCETLPLHLKKTHLEKSIRWPLPINVWQQPLVLQNWRRLFCS